MPVSYWPVFSLSPVTVPEAFAKVNSAQFPSGILKWPIADRRVPSNNPRNSCGTYFGSNLLTFVQDCRYCSLSIQGLRKGYLSYCKLFLRSLLGTRRSAIGQFPSGFLKWPIADRCVPNNDPRNNCGTNFGSNFLLVSKVVNCVTMHCQQMEQMKVETET